MIIDDTNERMDKSIQFLVSELKKIRAGKAMPSMLDGIMVEYYGAPTPLIQVASITTPDSRTIFIKPWEKTIIQDIEKAITSSDLGLNPQNDGENIIINIPPLTEERRMILVKQIKGEGEKGKISIRSVRKESNELMKKLSKDLSLPLVCTNDAHYSKREHSEAHDIHICLGTGKDRDDPNRLKYATPEFYFKTQDEMYSLFKDVPSAIENTRKIAESIDFEINTGSYHLPNFPIPKNENNGDPDEYLKSLVAAGVNKLYNDITPDINQQIDHELGVIKNMGFAGYFLITADFVQYAKNNDIPVGPGRGSAAGSLVSYALGITDIDPIKHNLLFERFLNPDRISMPDIDIDFCIERRGEVIDYIKSQYGETSVSQIITFGSMKAKQVIRDVGRVMGYTFSEVDRLAKAIPDELNITLDSAIKKSPEFRKMSENEYKELVDHSLVLEGMNRHASIHAAGVVIAPGELTDFVPLYKSSSGDITTQYDMKGLEDLGLLKMDFLGLRNLTVINKALELIKSKGEKIEIEKVSMEEPEVYTLFSNGFPVFNQCK